MNRPTKPRGRGQYIAGASPGRLIPFKPLPGNRFRAQDGRIYKRTIVPAQAASKANLLFWPHRKAKAKKPIRLGPMVCLNGRAHYSKADTKRMKRARCIQRTLAAGSLL